MECNDVNDGNLAIENSERLKKKAIARAEKFLLDCIINGLAHSYDTRTNKWVKPYPEATGYLLSFFSSRNPLPNKIVNAVKKLKEIQDSKTGGFCSFEHKSLLYTFDTGQIMHGFCSLYIKHKKQGYLDLAMSCGNFLLLMQLNCGAMFPLYDKERRIKYALKDAGWGKSFSYIQVKNVEGLFLLHEITGDNKWLTSAKRLCEWGKKNIDLTYTHPSAYLLEGLLAMGETDFVRNNLEEHIIPRIRRNGFIPYSEKLRYAYTSGSIQMAILLYKVGFQDYAQLILDWARRVQLKHDSGGLFQYANYDATLNEEVHAEINSWGTKYFVELKELL